MANHAGFLETQKKEILECFRDDNVKTVVLFGEAGVGKTWMAKEISNSASVQGASYGTIWVVPGYNSEGISLVEYVAIQLSVIPSSEEWDEYDNAETEHQEREKNLKQEIWKKLDQMKDALPGKNPYLLVVLDDINDQKEILANLNGLLSQHAHLLKFLITTRDNDIGIGSEGNGDTIRTDYSRAFEINFLSDVDSSNLLQNRVKGEVTRATRFERLCAAIGKCSSGHPGAIIMIAEALNQVGDFELENAVEEVACIIESADINTLLQHVYEMLPSTLNKCCWHCRYLFLRHDSSIHYNELITHWLLEGYFDHLDHIEKAYEEAHCTLIKLKSRGFLRGKENGYVCMDSDALRVTDRRREGLSGSACVGMASVLNDQTSAGLGRVIQIDGMIKTCSRERSEMSTLLIDGARYCREFPDMVFRQLKVLVIINPMFKELPSPLSELKELQVFVLRGCRILESVGVIHELTNLLVLEISGARKVEEIHDNLFELMKDLRSLNLSEVGIKWLPRSLLNRSKLRWLILRNCPNLEQLCDARLLNGKLEAEVLSLVELEVLDLSGSDSFQSIQVETLSPFKKLQTLNLSKTKVEHLPRIRGLEKLTRLLLSDCPSLSKLPTLKPLLELEIFDLSRTALKRTLQLPGLSRSSDPSRPKFSDLSHLLLSGCVDLYKLPSTLCLNGLEELNLSDASILEEFEDDSFEHLRSLQRLLLSNTKITALPSLPRSSELRLLSLKNCKSLTKLQDLSILQKLEVLDLSGCSELEIASTDSFRGMSHLKTINLSETKIKSLPQDCFPSSLRHLIIRYCPNWNKDNFPSLEDLSNLEVLDLCGANSLTGINLEFLRHMSKLRILNLSEIEFEQLPSLSHLTNLRELSLRGCSCSVSELDALKELELLDLSGTNVRSLPTLDTFTNLQQLLLRDCAKLKSLEKLESLTELEVLDISGTKIEGFPYEVLDLASLRKLNLQDMEHIKEIDWKRIKYVPEEFNLGGCGSPSPENAACLSISICGTGFFQFIEKNSTLWDTCFRKFHFSVWLPKKLDGRIYDLGDRGLLRDIESQGRIPHHEEPGQYLEIHGSYCNSSLPERVLEDAVHISLMDDSSFRQLSQLVKESLRSIKSCWLDRCPDIESIVHSEKDARVSGKLEFLNLCNLPSLTCICADKVQSEVFADLKSLYVDCCPKLAKIFPFSKLPKKLETLQVKFCDEMTKLFNNEVPAGCNLQNLDLLELPELKRIGVMMGSLQVLKVRQCPNLESLEEVLGEAENLRTLHISHAAGLESICSQEVKLGRFKSLNQLKIESCPRLKNVFSSSELPPNLKILEINSCESLETIFTGSSASSSLERLRLCSLPSLSSAVLKVPRRCEIPRDFNCPKLKIRSV